MNRRYLPKYENYIGPFRSRIDGSGIQPTILFVKSAMGTGKTSAFLDYIGQQASVLVISSRITYTNFMCSKNPSFESYLSLDTGRKIDYMAHPKIVLQYQSLHRIRDIDTSENHARWDVCFLDELDSIFNEAVTSTMTKRQKAANMNRFSKIISAIPTIIVCDANLTEWHYDVLLNHIVINSSLRSNHLVLNANKGLFSDGRRTLRVYTACSLSPQSFMRHFIGAVKSVYVNSSKRISSGSGNNKDAAAALTMTNEPIKVLVQLEQHLIKNRQCQEHVTIGAAENTYLWILHHWYRKETSTDPILNDFIQQDACTAAINDVMVRQQNVVLICATKSHAQMFYTYFTRYERLGGGTEVVMITGDSDPETKAWLSHNDTLNQALSRCRVFIYTSCFKVGIDVTCERFDNVYLFLNTIKIDSPLNVSDAYQMLGRVRKYQTLAICVTLPPQQQKKKKQRFEHRHQMTAVDEALIKEQRFMPGEGIHATVAMIASKIQVQTSVKRHSRLYMMILLKLLHSTIQKPDLCLAGQRYETIDRLCANMKGYPHMQLVFSKMILKYEIFSNRVGRLYTDLKRSVLYQLAYSTQLFSLNLFDDYVNYDSGGSGNKALEKEEAKGKEGCCWYKITEVYQIVTALTTEHGVYKACAAFDEDNAAALVQRYYNPRGVASDDDADDMLMMVEEDMIDTESNSGWWWSDARLCNNNYNDGNSSSSSSSISYIDEDGKDVTGAAAAEETTNKKHLLLVDWCVSKIKKLLYESFKLATRTHLCSYEEFIDRIPDIKAVIRGGCKDVAVIQRLYETFISEHVPVAGGDDIEQQQCMLEMVQNKLGILYRYNHGSSNNNDVTTNINPFGNVNINRFLIFAVS